MAVHLARRLLTACTLAMAGLCAQAQEVVESVITVNLEGRTLSALATYHQEHQPFQRVIWLMPGSPGIMKIESPTQFGMQGNFLIRSRKLWLDENTLVLSVDAPSDEWSRFLMPFRASERYAQDVRGLANQVNRLYGSLPQIIVGTSEGSISAYYVARALQGQFETRVIFTASVFLSAPNRAGLAALDLAALRMPMLWVHHASDPCRWTPYAEAQRMAAATQAPLITVRSSNTGSGDPCQARTAHGFIGAEEATVQVMRRWVLQGVAQDVNLP